ncbi:hypothetical protein [Streptomyces sp. NPDC059991]|uniref:hypothetical protein n=1 Tax=unclassified Streptomyces TaxID=2593676 RepID=UPI0036BB2893
MIDINFDDVTPEDLGLKHVTAEVAEARSRLAGQVCDELRKAGLPACLGTIDDPSPGAKIDVEPFEDGPAASVYWNCDPSVHSAYDTSRPDGGPAFQYFIQAAGHVQTAVIGILRSAGFTVERNDQDPLALWIWPDRPA